MAGFTTAFTQAQIEALTRNIARGVLEVEHNGKRTKFASIREALALLDRMKTEVDAAAAAASPTPPRVPYMTRRTVFIRD